MSKTDKTAPAWVRGQRGEAVMWAQHSRMCREGGQCTLPDRETAPAQRQRDWQTQCAWEPNYVKSGKKQKRVKGFCGCSMCTMKRERREWRRRIRHQKGRQIREELSHE